MESKRRHPHDDEESGNSSLQKSESLRWKKNVLLKYWDEFMGSARVINAKECIQNHETDTRSALVKGNHGFEWAQTGTP